MRATAGIAKTFNRDMTDLAKNSLNITAIAIGRNEGERLVRCLTSLLPQTARVIYVDSGSTDGSSGRALDLGAEVVALDMTCPFTAARARNAGFERVGDSEFVQFVDGDCEVDAGWLPRAIAEMAANPRLGVVAGRRRERFPHASVYNLICDSEWDTPVGMAQAVGGDMLARRSAIAEIGGFDPTLIAGEEPEMCLRLARAGWQIQRIDSEMTLHDAAMTRFSQWWKRSYRADHAFAEVSWRYRDGSEGYWKRETRRAALWAALLPVILLLSLAQPWFLLAMLVYPAQIIRMARRTPDPHDKWARAAFNVLGKFPEALGVAEYHLRRVLGRKSGLIEYK